MACRDNDFYVLDGHDLRFRRRRLRSLVGLDRSRLNIGAYSFGGAPFCLDCVIDYVEERRQFGARLADFQALQFHVADYATELETAHLLLHHAARVVTEGKPRATRLATQAKQHTTDIGFTVVNGCLQLDGGYYGYRAINRTNSSCVTCACTRFLKNDIMRMIVARTILGN